MSTAERHAVYAGVEKESEMIRPKISRTESLHSEFSHHLTIAPLGRFLLSVKVFIVASSPQSKHSYISDELVRKK